MRTVALFKAEAEEYRAALAGRGLAAEFVEPLACEAVNAAELAARSLRPHYAGLVLSSARAVDALAACWDPARYRLWTARPVYAVGEATARRTRARLGLEARGAEAGCAERLAAVIVAESEVGAELLFPCGSLRSEALPAALAAAGRRVDALVAYETRESTTLGPALQELSTRGAAALVFFSPSGCEYVHRSLQTFANSLWRLPRFAIGDSTAHRMQSLGLAVAGVAPRPSPDDLADTLHRYFAEQEQDS